MRDAIAFHAFPLAGIEPMSASTARAYPRQTHDQYGIGMIDAGGHASWSGRGQVEAGPGYFISVNAGEVHDGVARLAAHSTARPRREDGPTACIRRARHRIDADPAAPLTLIDLAKEAGLSRYQLIRAFARELGLTPHAYILQRRIALAQRMIRTGCDLAEVATAAGFCDQSHLTRWFVRQFGVTPRRYAIVAR